MGDVSRRLREQSKRTMKTPSIPHALDAPPSMHEGRRWRSRHQKKNLTWWMGLFLSLVWLYGVYRALRAFPLLPEIHHSPEAFWEVIGSGLALLMVSVALIVWAVKKR